jgi:hypothetical protein
MRSSHFGCGGRGDNLSHYRAEGSSFRICTAKICFHGNDHAALPISIQKRRPSLAQTGLELDRNFGMQRAASTSATARRLASALGKKSIRRAPKHGSPLFMTSA